ncbi:DUF1360 domain-containing protein [Pallidibacillus pasinlerensis]|uniref:DUF1360 domain-containing protein n=1 Tax=Pallidibacillus pasinlerensis TaxID=2703818 RepID=A0ABX0A8T5_9BACI|nr:DUF1360 domain-containing protein [Pallidibacillus pasinlerensis]NCU18924.1 DUF1360 domain-containing protein [Pallidibacillus pasinlerensis]
MTLELTVWEFVLIALATFRLTRLIVFDKITEFVRKPFIEEVEEINEHGEIEFYIETKGSGLRKWIGELLSCHWCTGMWVSIFLILFYLYFPFYAQIAILILAVAAVAAIIELIIGLLMDK